MSNSKDSVRLNPDERREQILQVATSHYARADHEAVSIQAIAKEAHRRKTGARALRGIVEELMLDLMYDLPSQSEVKEFTVTKAMVEQHTGGKVLPLPGADQQKTA